MKYHLPVATTADSTPALSIGKKAKLSGIYFLTFLAFSAILPYLSLYYDDIGFSGSQIGLLLGMSTILNVVATPFWTGLADSTRRHVLVTAVSVLFLLILYGLVPIFAQFLPVLILITLVSLLTPQLLPLEDSATMHMLGKEQAQYGRLRVWGTVGWGVGALIFGPLYNAAGLPWMFWCFGLVMFILLFLIPGLKFDQGSPPASKSIGILVLLKEPRWLLFLGIAFLAGLGIMTYQSFMPLVVNSFGQNDLTVFGFVLSPPALIGLSLVVGTMAELPLMFFSEKLLKWINVRNLALVCLSAVALRVLLFAFDINASHALAVQVLHGFTFAGMWLAGVTFSAKYAPPGLKATAQGLFSTVLLGLGQSAGNFASGALADLVGLQSMFGMIGMLLVGGLVAAWLIDRRFKILS